MLEKKPSKVCTRRKEGNNFGGRSCSARAANISKLYCSTCRRTKMRKLKASAKQKFEAHERYAYQSRPAGVSLLVRLAGCMLGGGGHRHDMEKRICLVQRAEGGSCLSARGTPCGQEANSTAVRSGPRFTVFWASQQERPAVLEKTVTSRRGRGRRLMSVCLSVCLSVSLICLSRLVDGGD